MSKYEVQGMTCEGCANAIRKAAATAHPNAKVEIDVAANAVAVEGMDELALKNLVEDAGFDFVGAA